MDEELVEAAAALMVINKPRLITLTEIVHRYISISGPIKENKLRIIFKNNPNTSKALRILLKEKIISRNGDGGRKSPYIYNIYNYF